MRKRCDKIDRLLSYSETHCYCAIQTGDVQRIARFGVIIGDAGHRIFDIEILVRLDSCLWFHCPNRFQQSFLSGLILVGLYISFRRIVNVIFCGRHSA